MVNSLEQAFPQTPKGGYPVFGEAGNYMQVKMGYALSGNASTVHSQIVAGGRIAFVQDFFQASTDFMQSLAFFRGKREIIGGVPFGND
jgi:hypothetical protein